MTTITGTKLPASRPIALFDTLTSEAKPSVWRSLPASTQRSCARLLIPRLRTLSGWITALFENAGSSEAFHTCFAEPDDDARNGEPAHSGACAVNHASQTYAYDFGFDLCNRPSAAYQGPLVVTDGFLSDPSPTNVMPAPRENYRERRSAVAKRACMMQHRIRAKLAYP